jgi:hypothetical protein
LLQIVFGVLFFAATFSMLAPAAMPARAGPVNIAGCPMFPPDNIWNARVDSLPVDVRSSEYITAMWGITTAVHPDFGAGSWQGTPIGMFYTTVVGTQPLVPIHYTAFGNQSDPGPFPIPPGAPVEGGSDLSNDGDRHVLVVDSTHCTLYELYYAFEQNDHSWNAGSGAVYSLTLNGPLRPDSWTSADAAGLPILPGLARYDEVASGIITHALRFTSHTSANAYLWPARHKAPWNTTPHSPPMGQRFRLKASFSINPGWSPQVKTILTALRQYGMILADNGSNWYISGTNDDAWDNDSLVNQLRLVKGSDFEAVDESSLMLDYNSGQVKTVTFANWLWLPMLQR